MTQFNIFGSEVTPVGDISKTVAYALTKDPTMDFPRVMEKCVEMWKIPYPISAENFMELMKAVPTMDRAIRRFKETPQDPGYTF